MNKSSPFKGHIQLAGDYVVMLFTFLLYPAISSRSGFIKSADQSTYISIAIEAIF